MNTRRSNLPPGSGPGRVLIVDDNALSAMLVEALLSLEGYTVAIVRDAQQALTVVADFKPQLILMDIELPGMDGLTLAQQLKSSPATRGIRIVVLTAHDAADKEAPVRAAGCDGLLTKPVDPLTFCETLRPYLANANAD